MKVSAVIPIKTNNQRLPGKNTKLLAGRPLYDYLFSTIKKCSKVDEVYVDSSDENILEIALSHGFRIIKRPVELNSPDTSGNDLLDFELSQIDSDVICQCFVTMPFLKSETIDLAVSTIEQSNSTSVLALCKVENRFWYKGVPVNHDYKVLHGTQYMDPVFHEAGFYVFKKEEFLKHKSRITDNHAIIEVSQHECIDIDTQYDFDLASVFASSLSEKSS